MVSGWYIWTLRNSIIALIVVLLFVSCDAEKEQSVNVKKYALRSGDIVCRLGNGFFSNYFRKYASKEQRYSHIGIVEVTGDTVFVIHTEASELTGIGYAKREPIADFVKGVTAFGCYRLQSDKELREKFVKKGKSYYLKHTAFDLDFDATDDAKVYCTELVATALNDAFDRKLIKPNLRLGDKYFYGLDAIYKNSLFSKLKMQGK